MSAAVSACGVSTAVAAATVSAAAVRCYRNSAKRDRCQKREQSD
jgi:hypothetical protein